MTIPAHLSSRTIRRIVNLGLVLLLITAWIVGFVLIKPEILPLIPSVLPGSVHIEQSGDIFIGYDRDGNIVGYASGASSIGYGGPMELLVGVDPDGRIIGIQVVEHRETLGFYYRIKESGFISQFLGLQVGENFAVEQQVDAISGATLSSEAIANSIRLAGEQIAGEQLRRVQEPINFDLPEITIIALYGLTFVLYRLHGLRRRAFQWVVMIVSMVSLGFIFNRPLTIGHFTTLLAGYWPDWHTDLYWYLLMGGVIGIVLLDGRNFYCHALCPFGAVQECFAQMGEAKGYRTPAFRELKRVQKGLAVLAVVLGLAFRQPAVTSYEPFGVLFAFKGNFPLWVLLFFVLFASMIMWRPFCTYLCPVSPAIEILLHIRKMVKKVWEKMELSLERQNKSP